MDWGVELQFSRKVVQGRPFIITTLKIQNLIGQVSESIRLSINVVIMYDNENNQLLLGSSNTVLSVCVCVCVCVCGIKFHLSIMILRSSQYYSHLIDQESGIAHTINCHAILSDLMIGTHYRSITSDV